MLTESRNILRLIVSKFRLAVTFLHVSLLFFFSSLGCCQANYTNIILSWILGTIWQNSIVWLVNFRLALKFSVQLFHSLGIVKQMWVLHAYHYKSITTIDTQLTDVKNVAQTDVMNAVPDVALNTNLLALSWCYQPYSPFDPFALSI